MQGSAWYICRCRRGKEGREGRQKKERGCVMGDKMAWMIGM